MMTIDDQLSLPRIMVRLQHDFPDWHFTVFHRYDGPRLEAYRPHAESGLYALITDDAAELRRELDDYAACA
jgi:hypothetical protein